MQLWFHEVGHHHFGLQFAVRQTLCQVRSEFQEIAILETEGFGKMMVLDGCVMLTERDEFFYHEMLAHPALCVHPSPTRVLVIGGGDGGTVREVLRHPGIQHVDLVELDEQVVRVAKKYLPALSTGLNDSRVSVHFEDGVAFLQNAQEPYDVILIDSTDPVGPASGLIQTAFFQNCQRAMHPDGILVMQSESPFLHSKELITIHQNLKPVFHRPQLYLTPMISYPSGWWSFTWASHTHHPKQLKTQRAQKLCTALKYYNPDIHHAALALPNFVQELFQTEHANDSSQVESK
ncbi:MAG: polyamine aminopropyltransferase [Myxococcota bacterium]